MVGVVDRERLFRALDFARRTPLIWISGPPGSGKTTLVSSYVEARQCPHLWYQIDPDDDDPSTFFHYLSTGLPAKRRRPLGIDGQEGDPASAARRFFRALFRELPSDVVLVLDGYEQVSDASPLHDVLREAAAQVPPGTSIVVVSRTPPPPATIGLHATGRLSQLSWTDLRLTPDEVARITATDSASATALHTACDGWPAGLRLLATDLGTNQHPDAKSTADLHHLATYFSREVLERQSSAVQDHLLRTSVVPDLTPSLAQALSGNREAPAILDRLHRENVFTVRLGSGSAGYRYHDLFRTFLRERACAALGQAQVERLLTEAGRWYAANGQPERAVAAFLDASDWMSAGHLMLRAGPLMTLQGRHSTVRQWIGRLPGFLVDRSGALLTLKGEATLPVSPARARELFERSSRRFEAERNDAGCAIAASGVLQSYYFEQADFTKLDPSINLLAGILRGGATFDAPETELRAWSTLQTSLTLRRPRDPFLPACADRVLALLGAAIEINQRVRAATLLLGYLDWFRCNEAPALVRLVRTWLDTPELALFEKAWWQLAEFHHYRQRGDVEAARQSLARWRAVHEEAELQIPTLPGMIVELWERSSHGSGKQVDTLLGKTLKLGTYTDLRPQEKMLLASLHAESLLQRRDFSGAADALASALHMATTLGCEGHAIQLALCDVIARAQMGDIDGARTALAALEARLPAEGATRLRFGHQLVAALLAHRAGDTDTCDAALRSALATGRRERYVHTHLWLPWMMSELALLALERDIEAAYVRELVRTRALPAPNRRARAWPWQVRVSCLGVFEIDVGGELLAFTGKAPKRPLELLRGLVARGGRRVSADDLAEMLWPDAEGDAAADAFTMALHRLRKLLGSDSTLLLDEGRLSLNPELCWLDCWAFEAAADDAMDVAALNTALALYRGPFLSGESPQGWTLLARDRLSQRVVRLVEAVAGNAVKNGDLEDAVLAYRRGIEVDSLCEPFHRGLIGCLIGLGRRTEATMAYERCRAMFLMNVGVPPSSATESLLQPQTAYGSVTHP